jgi:hypothetical protein
VCVKENVVGYQIMQNNKDTVEQSNWSFFPLYAITVLPGWHVGPTLIQAQ